MFEELKKHLRTMANNKLNDAVYACDAEGVTAALKAGADIHLQENRFLGWAIQQNWLEIARLLIEGGIDVKARSDELLDTAVVFDRKDAVALLLDHGADVNVDDGISLAKAAVYGKADMVRLLLERGADISVRNYIAFKDPVARDQAEIVDIVAAHIFRPTAWVGKSSREVEAELEKLAAIAKTATLRGVAPPPSYADKAIEQLTTHARPIFHEARRREVLANQIKPHSPKPPRPL